MPLSPRAQRLLRLHADRHEYRFYGDEVLGSLFPTSDFQLLDAAYEELLKAGLVAHSGSVVSYFGRPTILYEITEEGMRKASQERVA